MAGGHWDLIADLLKTACLAVRTARHWGWPEPDHAGWMPTQTLSVRKGQLRGGSAILQTAARHACLKRRSSSVNSIGCSNAAKCPPRGTSFQ